MAVVKPFRAERYDESKAGPLERLVAPPYDVLSAEQREEYLARSPYNVVHLTLPDDEEQAGRDVTDWRDTGRAGQGSGARLLAPFTGLCGPGWSLPNENGVGRLAPSRAL